PLAGSPAQEAASAAAAAGSALGDAAVDIRALVTGVIGGVFGFVTAAACFGCCCAVLGHDARPRIRGFVGLDDGGARDDRAYVVWHQHVNLGRVALSEADHVIYTADGDLYIIALANNADVQAAQFGAFDQPPPGIAPNLVYRLRAEPTGARPAHGGGGAGGVAMGECRRRAQAIGNLGLLANLRPLVTPCGGAAVVTIAPAGPALGLSRGAAPAGRGVGAGDRGSSRLCGAFRATRLCPRLRVVPMGWSWATWWCQSAMERAAEAAGCQDDMRLRDGRPAPPLGPACHLVCVDHFVSIEYDAVAVRDAVVRVMAEPKRRGLAVTHEGHLGDNAGEYSVLGLPITSAGRLSASASRLWRARLAGWALLRRGRASGRDLERVLGRVVFVAIACREGPIIFEFSCRFVQQCHRREVPLWAQVRQEFMAW
ncbi:unnamed protein product, partial [Prorocentrum cordatum]